MSRHIVVTAISDELYKELFVRASQAGGRSIEETFHGDSEPTRIWVAADGSGSSSLMSKMPSEPYEKRIEPYSATMQEISGKGGTSSNRWRLIERFVALGMDNRAAIGLATNIYDILPSHVVVSDETAEALYEHHTNGGPAQITFVIGDKGELVARRHGK